MIFKLIESKEQGNILEEWQYFFLIHTSGAEVCYLQKNGINGLSVIFDGCNKLYRNQY